MHCTNGADAVNNMHSIPLIDIHWTCYLHMSICSATRHLVQVHGYRIKIRTTFNPYGSPRSCILAPSLRRSTLPAFLATPDMRVTEVSESLLALGIERQTSHCNHSHPSGASLLISFSIFPAFPVPYYHIAPQRCSIYCSRKDVPQDTTPPANLHRYTPCPPPRAQSH